ncbi:MAG: hypothetical protein HGA87_05915, partial [Desulfobulbaceae bacterium]|nr:hypothetical protein [Desulfobulbaceae bacterium]
MTQHISSAHNRNRLFFLTLAFLLSFFSFANAQTVVFYENSGINERSEKAIPNSTTRTILPLTGQWSAKIPDGAVSQITIPSSYAYSGVITFERTIKIPKSHESRHFELVCEGVNNQCKIYVNDQFVKFHGVSGTPFQIDIPSEYLHFGADNKIAIEVDSRLDGERSMPVKPSAFSRKNFAGIFRNIYLVSEPEMKIDDVDLDYTMSGDTLNLNMHIKVKTFSLRGQHSKPDSARTQKVRGSFRMMMDSVVIANTPNIFEFKPQRDLIIQKDVRFAIRNIRAWSPDYPARYKVEFSIESDTGLVIDQISFQTGFRSVGMKSGIFMLNGTPFPLKGVTIIEEAASSANSLSSQAIQNNLSLVKSLGANAVRFKECPAPQWMSLCDSLGLIVLAELPTENIPSSILDTKSYAENAELFLRELIAETKHNPSVVAYGFGTGIDLNHPGSEQYLIRLQKLVKETGHNLTFFSPKNFAPSPSLGVTDFIGLSLKDNTIADFRKLIEDAQKSLPPSQSLVIVEYGTAVQPNNHNGYNDKHSIEYQAKYFLDHYKLFDEINKPRPFIAGSFAYALSDYHYEIPPVSGSGYTDVYLSTYGLTTLEGEKKMGYEMLKSLYAEERVYNPPIGKNEPLFSPSLILIATLLTAALVFLLNENRRIRENLIRAIVRPFHLFMDIRDLRINSPMEPLVLMGLLTVLWGSIVSAIFFSARDSFALEFWLSHIVRFQSLRELLNFLIVHPSISTIVYAVVFFILSLMLAGLFMLYLFIAGKTRVTYLQVLNIWTWSSVHWIVFIFIAAFIDRFESSQFTFIILLVSLAFLLLAFLRAFRGLSIVCNIPPLKVYLVGVLSLVTV